MTTESTQATNLFRPLVDENFVARAREICAQLITPVGTKIDADDIYPSEIIAKLAAMGYNTITLPEEYGGSARPLSYAVAAMEEFSYGSGALGISLITIFQTQRMICQYGSTSLRDAYLPKYANGLRTSYALTESGHGSDIRHLDTKARDTGNGWVISGEKAFITSGSAADLFIVLAETGAGLTVFAVPRDAAGISTFESPDAKTFGLRNGPHVNLILDDVRVPADHMIGTEGRGLKQAMTVLSSSRILAAAISIGIARAAFDGAIRAALGREVFGQKVAELQGIQWYFADAHNQLEAARLLTYRAAEETGGQDSGALASSEAKAFSCKIATEVASMAVQVCGARGTMESSPFGRYLRDAKAYEVAGGSTEILRNTIAKSIIARLA